MINKWSAEEISFMAKLADIHTYPHMYMHTYKIRKLMPGSQ